MPHDGARNDRYGRWSMQALAAIFLGICAGFAIVRAFDAYRWRETRRFWICAVIALPLVAATGIALWDFFASPIMHHGNNFGFGSDWTCTYPGDGDPVCIQQMPTKSTAPATRTKFP